MRATWSLVIGLNALMLFLPSEQLWAQATSVHYMAEITFYQQINRRETRSIFRSLRSDISSDHIAIAQAAELYACFKIFAEFVVNNRVGIQQRFVDLYRNPTPIINRALSVYFPPVSGMANDDDRRILTSEIREFMQTISGIYPRYFAPVSGWHLTMRFSSASNFGFPHSHPLVEQRERDYIYIERHIQTPGNTRNTCPAFTLDHMESAMINELATALIPEINVTSSNLLNSLNTRQEDALIHQHRHLFPPYRN